MSGLRFSMPLTQWNSPSGPPYPGATLTFYIAGTSTKLDTFSDNLLTTQNSNPVVADGNGTFSSIWLTPGLPGYKVVLATSTGAQIWTADNIVASDSNVWDVAIFIEGKPTASEVYPIIWPASAMQLPVGLAASQFHIAINPTATMTFTFQKDGANIGSVAFSTGGVATVTFATLIPFTAGLDNFSVTAQASPDATGAGISMTIRFQLV